jgi:hypothetical protein
MYVNVRLGLRTTSALIGYLSKVLNWDMPSIPSPVSIKNWVEKSGYKIYMEPKKFPESHAVIMDECMMIGSQKLLLTLGVDAQKEDNKALCFEDVNILNMSVRPSWNAATVGEAIKNISSGDVSGIKYLISDNASTLVKATRDLSLEHISDVGHTIALFVERVYKKNSEFKSFWDEITAVKFKEIMRSTAYLLPPKQRSIARFMNLSATVQWAHQMQKNIHRLTETEQQVFGFISKYANIINELHVLFDQIDEILITLKNDGLSYKSADQLLEQLNVLQSSSKQRSAAVFASCSEYLKCLRAKLPDEKSVWHVSSDIIESFFGYFKFRKSPNPLYGVTTHIFMLPVLTRSNSKTGESSIDFKRSLEDVFLRDLNDWRNTNLPENLVVKRTELLKAG